MVLPDPGSPTTSSGVRTALFNWLYARQQGGQFILRIDDTDQKRNLDSALQPILDGFRWLGLDWDEGPEVGGPHGPYFQSQRADRYQAAVDRLLQSGHAYRDYARPEEIEQERQAARKANGPFQYSRRWMAESERQAADFEAEGRSCCVRLKMPREGVCRFQDAVRGDAEFQWPEEQDHIVQRSSGGFTYHLASVVDDHDFQITHVIRAVEHYSNTPRQIFIAESLGYEAPHYVHVPYVAEPGSKKKLSKRSIAKYLNNREFKKLYEHGAAHADLLNLPSDLESFNPVLTDFYIQTGYLPDAVVNYLLLLGWALDDNTEDFTRSEMIAQFSLERINQAPASFDPAKLEAFQERHMNRLPLKQKTALCVRMLQRAGWIADPPPCETGPRVQSVLQAAGERIRIAADILNLPEFFLADEQLLYDDKAFQKRLGKPESQQLLRKFRAELETAAFEPAALEELLDRFVKRESIKKGDIIHALRVAVTGRGVGLGTYETLALIGRDSSLKRIDQALRRAADH